MLRGRGEEKLEGRLSELTTGRTSRLLQEGAIKDASLMEAFDTGHNFFEDLVAKIGRLGLLFEQADTSLTATRFFAISGMVAAAAAVTPLAAGLHPGLAPVFAVLGGVLPLFWLMFRRGRRMKKFAAQLPDALELIARALRAGHSLGSGFQLVADEMSEPISKEFQRAFDEQNLGVSLDESLDSMTDRMPNLDLKFFCTAVVLQRQTGGDLAEILDKIGHLIRERFRIWGQVQALTGEGRLSGIVLLALPPALFVAVWKLNPDYVSVLFTDPMGKQMLIGGIVMQVLGALVIRKIVNIKV
ncbi:MAG: secretion protein [Planctomycetota bacterium]|nr:MAG: secretion protein [Planctomycetota bacterium]REJ89004.1 MAG: secretion protein [Planctomycetota bacterium]